MIPERFSLSNLEFDEYNHKNIRLRTGNDYYPILYNIDKEDYYSNKYYIDGFRTPDSLKTCEKFLMLDAEQFYHVYKEHFEDYKLAIKKLLIKNML